MVAAGEQIMLIVPEADELMPVEAFIRTDERTMWSYLLKPLTDQARRAFREHLSGTPGRHRLRQL